MKSLVKMGFAQSHLCNSTSSSQKPI